MCFQGALDVTNVSSSSQSTFVGFAAKDQLGDPNAHFYFLVSCLSQGDLLGRGERKQAGL